jgi:hypothetical protein
MPWEHIIGNVKISPNSNVEKNWSKWDALPLPARQNLQAAVPMAANMVERALTALKGHLTLAPKTAPFRLSEEKRGTFKVGRLVHDPNVELDHSEVGQGLVKYFNLKSSKVEYWKFVQGIVRTFMEIKTNLTNGYTLILADLNTKVGERGRVERSNRQITPASDADSFRKRFGFVTNRFGRVDENGHVLYYEQYWTIGDIQISVEWVCDQAKPPEAEAIARTIVHEASHKWAFTDDVLYKHESFAKLPDDHPDFKYRDRQETIKIPGRDDLLPIMGMETDYDEQPVLITVERLLENADSYAWFARRMRKRAHQ